MKKYVFKPYNKKFPELFENEKRRLLSFSKKDLLIEHVGSTAVPYLGGKGIIDIAIGVKEGELNTIIQEFQEAGYDFRIDHSTVDRLFFRADLEDVEEGKRRYHLHVMHPTSKEWKNMLAFRDYLRSHPEEAKRYSELKRESALKVEEDGAQYRALKEPFFDEIFRKIEEEIL